MATEISVNIGSGNGLFPDCTKPLPEPMLTDHQWSPSDIHTRAISQQMPQPSITKIRLKITYLNFHSNFPGANEINNFGDQLSNTSSVLPKQSAVDQVDVAAIVISSNTCCVWICICVWIKASSYQKRPALNIYWGASILWGALLFCDNLQTLLTTLRVLLLGRVLLIGTLRYVVKFGMIRRTNQSWNSWHHVRNIAQYIDALVQKCNWCTGDTAILLQASH